MEYHLQSGQAHSESAKKGMTAKREMHWLYDKERIDAGL
jgi:hypothetical protein